MKKPEYTIGDKMGILSIAILMLIGLFTVLFSWLPVVFENYPWHSHEYAGVIRWADSGYCDATILSGATWSGATIKQCYDIEDAIKELFKRTNK